MGDTGGKYELSQKEARGKDEVRGIRGTGDGKNKLEQRVTKRNKGTQREYKNMRD